VRGSVVRPSIGLDLDDASGRHGAPSAVDEDLAEQEPRDAQGRLEIEGGR